MTRRVLTAAERAWLLSGAPPARTRAARALDRPVRRRRYRLADTAAVLDAVAGAGDPDRPGPARAAAGLRTRCAAGHTLAQAVAADPVTFPEGTAALLDAYAVVLAPAAAASRTAERLRSHLAARTVAARSLVAPARGLAAVAVLAAVVTVLVGPPASAVLAAAGAGAAGAAWAGAYLRVRGGLRRAVTFDDGDARDVAALLVDAGVPVPAALRRAASVVTDPARRARWTDAAARAARGDGERMPPPPRTANGRAYLWAARAAAAVAWVVALHACVVHG